MQANNSLKIAVLASGKGSNFKALVQNDIKPGIIDILISDREDARALQLAGELNIEAKFMYPGSYRTKLGIPEEIVWTDFLKNRGIELICLAGFMRIIKGPLLDEFAGRIMNIHPSLLPAFPGLDAQGQAFKYGVKVAGCTVHYVDRGTDTGPVIFQESVSVNSDDTRDTLAERILKEEHRIYAKAVKQHCSGNLQVKNRSVLLRNKLIC